MLPDTVGFNKDGGDWNSGGNRKTEHFMAMNNGTTTHRNLYIFHLYFLGSFSSIYSLYGIALIAVKFEGFQFKNTLIFTKITLYHLEANLCVALQFTCYLQMISFKFSIIYVFVTQGMEHKSIWDLPYVRPLLHFKQHPGSKIRKFLMKHTPIPQWPYLTVYWSIVG